jgi:hypothetical protein
MSYEIPLFAEPTTENPDRESGENECADCRVTLDKHGYCPECEPCPHDDLDHGICMDCEADLTDDLIAAAEMAAEGER